MKNRFKGLILTLSAALLLFGAAPIYADPSSSTTTSLPNNESVSSVTYASSITDADLAQIDTLFNENINLLVSLKQTDIQISAANETNTAALHSLHIDKVQDTSKLKDLHNKNEILRKSLNDSYQKIKELRSKMKGKNAKQKKALQKQMKVIQVTIQAVMDQIKENEKATKGIHSEVLSDSQKALITQIEGFRDQIKSIQQADTTWDKQRKSGWVAFYAAIHNVNGSDAITSLSSIVDANQKILANKQQILLLKQKISAAISSYSGANSSPAGSTASSNTTSNTGTSSSN